MINFSSRIHTTQSYKQQVIGGSSPSIPTPGRRSGIPPGACRVYENFGDVAKLENALVLKTGKQQNQICHSDVREFFNHSDLHVI